jgi:hypothetical protein
MTNPLKGPGQIQLGETYSNDLTERYLEHRKVIGFELGLVQYEIVRGKRTGSKGSCTREAFWCWQRMQVRTGRAVRAGLSDELESAIARLESKADPEARQIAGWLRELIGLRGGVR